MSNQFQKYKDSVLCSSGGGAYSITCRRNSLDTLIGEKIKLEQKVKELEGKTTSSVGIGLPAAAGVGIGASGATILPFLIKKLILLF